MEMTQRELHQMFQDMYGQEAFEEYIDARDKKRREQTGIYFAQEAYKAQAERKKYERIEKENLEKLKQLSEGKTTEWGEFIFVKTMRAGSINYSAIPELINVRLEDYRKSEVESWSLTKKG